MSKKPYRINNKDVVVKSENAVYDGNISGVDNAQDAIDNLDERVLELESAEPPVTPVTPDSDVTEYVYTEADCTLTGQAIYTNATSPQTKNGYNCSEFITIPPGAKMYIKMNFTFSSSYPLLFYSHTNTGSNYDWMTGKNFYGGSLAEYTELVIPENAVAIRFNFPVSASNHISIKFVVEPKMENVVKLRVAAWNIGHFGGGASSSGITDDNVEAKRAAYRKQFDEANADIICFSEFDTVFNTDTSSAPKDEILSNYPYYSVGTKGTYNCNAIFSRLPILQTQERYYQVAAQNRYVKEVTLKLNGKIVKVVATHLDFENSAHTSNYVAQFAELIPLYENDPYVIIGADFNVHIDDQFGEYVDGSGTDGYLNYQYLTEAGYTLVNCDYLMIDNPWRYPAGDSHAGELKGSYADNIAVKGFAMGRREWIYTEDVSNTLSDHCMIACELVML